MKMVFRNSKIVWWMSCFLLCVPLLSAQDSGIQIRGQVVTTGAKDPVEFATVGVYGKENREMINGTTTLPDGTFKLEVKPGEFYIQISFLGYETLTIEDFSVENAQIALGVIGISENAQMLDEVVVRAEKSQTEFQLDKKVFNVGQDLTSAGASVLEVLNNVPSVTVSIEGQISLRGSAGVQILINGKPSVLTSGEGNILGTITADMVEKVEVITNPSAKYEAEGTAGIINIVLKKEEREGLNGSISLNTGIPHNHSLGLSLNRRTEKFNLFSQFGVGYRELPNDIQNVNRDLTTNNQVISQGREFRNENFYNVILGTDYHIDDYNVLTLSGFFAYEIEDQPSRTNFQLLDAEDLLVSEWQREEITEATNPKYQYELQYKREFKDNEEHTLLFSTLGNFFGKDLSSEFTNTTLSGSDTDGKQRTESAFQEAEYTFKLDYTRPISDDWTLETGALYVLNNVSNDYSVSDLINGDWIVNPDFTNLFEYDQKVLGAYATGAYEGKKWGIKVGLRVEHTDLNTLLINTGEANRQNFVNLFPSAHTSFKISEAFSLQAGYSRRIFRPRLWDLNPFFNIRNNFSIRTGNPNLLPEFTDSYEMTGILILGEASMNLGVYYRYTADVVERISTFEDNVTTVRPENIGTNRTTGVEFNAKYSPGNWFTVSGDINYNYFNRQGSFQSISFDFNNDQWSGRVVTKFKLPLDIDLEVSGLFQSRLQTVQSEISGMVFADMGIRKKILKGKGVVNFSIRDIFASRIFESTVAQPNFNIYNRRLRGRFVTLGFSYGFGKGEAMEYSGGRRW